MYEIYPDRILGFGTSATVYLGRCPTKNNYVAIKVINVKEFSRDTENWKRVNACIQSEIEIMKCLDHKHILKFYDSYSDLASKSIIMEYCKYGDLSTNLRHRHGILESDIKKNALQLVDGVKYMVENNIMHRDLKTKNLLLSEDNNIKICDFGFAKKMMHSDVTDTICGSPLYMAPEILSGGKYTNIADLWSIGIILYELITGKFPIMACSVSQLREYYAKTTCIGLPSDTFVSEKCKDLISKILVIDPNKRMTWGTFFSHPWILSPDIQIDACVRSFQIIRNYDAYSEYVELISNLYDVACNPVYTDNCPRIINKFRCLCNGLINKFLGLHKNIENNINLNLAIIGMMQLDDKITALAPAPHGNLSINHNCTAMQCNDTHTIFKIILMRAISLASNGKMLSELMNISESMDKYKYSLQLLNALVFAEFSDAAVVLRKIMDDFANVIKN